MHEDLVAKKENEAKPKWYTPGPCRPARGEKNIYLAFIWPVTPDTDRGQVGSPREPNNEFFIYLSFFSIICLWS